MTILDRLRAQSPQKHPDAAVRLAFVQEVPLSDRPLLIEIAREDADARVRKAAVAKLMDVDALASVAKGDAEDAVREQALAMLRDIALEAFEGVGQAEGLTAAEALSALGDLKTLAVVAKSAPSVTVASRARAAITDSHTLGSIARHAEHEAIRREAFASLDDHREILSLALNSEFRDPTLAAVERITDRDELEQLAARAKNKSAAKRARAIVREMDDRAARETAAAAEALSDTARAEEAARQAAAQAATAEQIARLEADRRASLERAAAARTESEKAAAEAEAERVRKTAERDRERREAAARETERSQARMAELAVEAARVVAMEDVAAARRQATVIRREWADLSSRATPDVNVLEQYAGAEAEWASRDNAAREADQKARRNSLVRLQQLLSRVEPLGAREDLALKAGERALTDVRAALGAMPQFPSKQDFDDISRRLKAVQTALTPKVQELREVAGWQRWANVGLQEQLCEQMEALRAVDDPEQIAKQVKDLQLQWRQAADVPRAQGEALWKRFKAAHDEAWTKCEAHFAAQAGERAENLAKKTALCERAAALAESTNWIQTAEEIKKLQAEWKAIGPVSRGQEKSIWERFRSACDRFFTRRHADLAERKKVWGDNLARKDALIAKVEALAQSTDWDVAAAEIKRLQNEWKTVGPVKKTRSEALWLRFRGACDTFFARYAQRHDIAKGERLAAREAIVSELEALTAVASQPPPVDGPESSVDRPESPVDSPASPATSQLPATVIEPAGLAVKVRDLRARWQQEIAARGVDRDRAVVLDERFARAFAAVLARWPSAFAGSELDPDSNRKRMEALVKRAEDLAASLSGQAEGAAAALSPANRLAAMLKESWAANTIGGKADNDNRIRAAQEEVRQAQASWSRIGPVPDETRRALADRFQRAIRRISDKAGELPRAGGSGSASGAGGNRAGGAGRPGGPGKLVGSGQGPGRR